MTLSAGWDGNPKFAKYYDLITGHKDYLKECDFIEEALSRFLRVPPNKLLDIGCGTGTHALELARRGYRVSAFDLAKPMIEIAKKKNTGGQVEFRHGQITDYKGNDFDALICMFDTVGYLATFSDFIDFLRNMNSAMSRRGILLFDTWNGPAVLKMRPSSKLRMYNTKVGKIYRYSEPEMDVLKQLTVLNYHCLIVKGKEVVDEFDSRHNIRFYTPEQVQNALDLAGFKMLKSCASINLEKAPSDEDWTVSYIVTPEEGN
jgi:2-polyprenyl-3-methyl-5-hydroxy-6-metoxy-1,4-benzoquinol methylase